ncbi:MAG TPA: hypothetical protein VJT50_02880 [Pyrinomonadaceae bacterium]|nr:hypothetical protein [Pyrinomonadaceae bacterium]
MKSFEFAIKNGRHGISFELTNTSRQTLKAIEILTIFLKDEHTPDGGPSAAHIRFEPISSMRPNENVALLQHIWIDGRPSDNSDAQLERLRIIPGELPAYALDISWQDENGKSAFQRIPVGHRTSSEPRKAI